MSIQEVTMYRAVCDKCDKGADDEEYAWSDDSSAITQAEESGWFLRWEPNGKLTTNGYPARELTALICPSCKTCEVCDTGSFVYECNGHLVCDDHEDHDFPEVKA